VRVLIAGSTGFIGRQLAAAFAGAGHEVWCGARTQLSAPQSCSRHVPLDYTSLSVAALTPLVAGCDVVINAVGILRASDRQTFEALHTDGPRALFAACQAASVPRVIQISALGADRDAASRYHRSKRAADQFLMELPLDWAVVQPSLVYGPGGTSARLFDLLATLPVTPLPAGGRQQVQPVFIDDVIDVVLALAEHPGPLRCVLPVVGPEPLELRAFLAQLRAAMGKSRARALTVPGGLMRTAARAGDHMPGFLLDSDTWQMLERGNIADAGAMTQWLGRSPRPVRDFVPPGQQPIRRLHADLLWLLPLLRASVAVMWVVAGVVSLYRVDSSLELLRSIGSPPALAPILFGGAIIIDLAFGILTLWPRRPRRLWSAQIAVVVVYTLIITFTLPALWLEPFGPVAKNLPILALLLLLQQLERRS
jgi:uncharacterized protein YbjT (DUF2867 family)/uncharacterized membrane protein YphA (DoxX/SURF4 family)